MLTYATLDDFKVAKQVKNIKVGTSGITAEALALADDKIIDYLKRATRYINRFTRREFFPRIQTRRYPVPHKFLDLQLRRFLTAPLYLDEDLLEIIELENGAGFVLTEGEDYFFNDANIYPLQAVELKFPNFWGGQYEIGILSRTFNEPIINITGIWGYHDGYPRDDEAWVNTLEVVPVGGIDDSQTTISVTDANGKDNNYVTRFVAGNMIKIDSEFLEVVEINDAGTTLTVIRGVRGSTAAAHDEGATIFKWKVVEDIVEATIQIAKTWREADTAIAGRIGVTDLSAGVEIGIPGDPLNVIKMYQRTYVGFL